MLSFRFLLVLCVVPVFSHSDELYKNGYFLGRSAAIVLDDHTTKPAEIQLQWHLTKNQETVNNVRDVHVHSLVSRALGLPQVHLPTSHSLESELDDVVPFNFFSAPRGNMLFSVEGLSVDDIPSSTKTLGRTPTYTLHQSSRPYHPLSMLATISTGTIPRKHGIVNEEEPESTVPNLNDVVKGLYHDSSIIVGSGCRKSATVLSPHKSVDSYFWDDELEVFQPLNQQELKIVVNKENIPVHLAALPLSVFYNGLEGKIGEVNFDLHDKVDNILFAEIAFVTAWSSHLRQVEGSFKSFSFHFKSLAMITAKYGRESQQWRAALEAIDITINHSILGDCTLEVVYLPTYHNQKNHILQEKLAPIVSPYVSRDFFPHLHLNSEGLDKQSELCEQILNALTKGFPEVTVFCPLKAGHEKRAIEQSGEPHQLAPVTASIPTVLQFHYVFWTMMVVIAILSWATYAIATIEPDESLYTAATYYKKGGKAL